MKVFFLFHFALKFYANPRDEIRSQKPKNEFPPTLVIFLYLTDGKNREESFNAEISKGFLHRLKFFFAVAFLHLASLLLKGESENFSVFFLCCLLG